MNSVTAAVNAVTHVQVESLRGHGPVRSALSEAHIERLAEILEDCPPIVVTPSGVLVDGAHRVAAARRRQWTTIPAEVCDAASEVELLSEAARANSVHGLPLTRVDRRAAAVRLLELTDLSDRAIAATCGVGRGTVSMLRSELQACSGGPEGQVDAARRTGADGKRYRPADRTMGRVAEALVRLDPALSVRGLAERLDVSVGTAHRLQLAARARMEQERLWARWWHRMLARWIVRRARVA